MLTKTQSNYYHSASHMAQLYVLLQRDYRDVSQWDLLDQVTRNEVSNWYYIKYGLQVKYGLFHSVSYSIPYVSER